MKSHYKGGSILTTFRLPKDHYIEAREQINELLRKYHNKPQSEVKPIQCGCRYEGSLFRRDPMCKIPKDKHKR